MSRNIIPLYASRHLYRPVPYPGGGIENPIFINPPP